MPPFRPCIYQPLVPTQDLAAGLAPAPGLAAAAAMGLDHLMVAGGSGPQAGVVKAARAAGLALILELSLDRPAQDSELLREHPHWRAHDGAWPGDLPDPRQPPGISRAPGLRLDDPEVAPAVTAWWGNRLAQWASQGVAGFCLHLDGPAPPGFFAGVMAAVRAAVPDCRFLAWTPGVPASRVEALAACGFDAAFSSSAWWDFRAPWLAEETARLRAYGAVVALAGVPAQASASPLDSSQRERLCWLAALTADSMLLTGEDLGATPGQVPPAQRALALCRETRHPRPRHWDILSAPNAPVALLRTSFSQADGELVMASNATDKPATLDLAGAISRFDGLALVDAWWPRGEAPEAGHLVTLAPAQTVIYTARRKLAAAGAARDTRRAAEAAARTPRIAIENLTPCIDGGRFVAKRNVGDMLVVEADIFGEGHDRMAAALLWRTADDEAWNELSMQPIGNDRWRAEVLLPRIGRYQYQLEAWIDVFGAWRDEVEKKVAAGQQVMLELREGVALLQAALERAGQENRQQLALDLRRTLHALEGQHDQEPRLRLLLSDAVHQLMKQADAKAFKVRSAPLLQVDAERRAAVFSGWYELFPRSLGPAGKHGSLRDVAARLPAIRAMGFDTLYFPPIHPIGMKHRKGRNNALEAAEGDPGSPYAIGAADGGHDAIHAELGTLADFRALRNAAQEHGLELALDFAIQCSPDHPWLKAHPDWFSWRPDGSIRYAENPPKKYQDIVNVDFYAGGAVPALWLALRDVVLFWVKEGVKVFRVDNPHTKPMPFWEWLIADVRSRFADVIFLAEAFTRPKPMYRLAKLGFSQSYTYFTWRYGKQEFIDYLTELADGPPRDFFRPHFFVNTPDINPYFLQRSGRAGFVIRAALAATLSGLWGLYSGFELCEAEPVPGKEEYLHSEKYELRQRDWSQPGNIVREITLLNSLRHSNPALQTHLGIRFCASSGDDILCFTKTAPGLPGAGSNILFVAICLDPHAPHECAVELPLQDWGLEEGATLAFDDLTHGSSFTLHGRHQRVRLDPSELAFSIWRLRPGGTG